jgi:hypothetical protein
MTDARFAAAELRDRYGPLLDRAPATGDPTGESCAAIDAAQERLRGPRAPAGQLTLAALPPINLALCRDDRCPWKYRGATWLVTEQEAAEHAREQRHKVTLYLGDQKVRSIDL